MNFRDTTLAGFDATPDVDVEANQVVGKRLMYAALTGRVGEDTF